MDRKVTDAPQLTFALVPLDGHPMNLPAWADHVLFFHYIDTRWWALVVGWR